MKKILSFAIMGLGFTSLYAQDLTPCYDEKERKYNYCDGNGKVVLQRSYDIADYFSERGFASVKMGKESYLINKKGEKVSASYEALYEATAKPGTYWALKQGNWGMVSDAGKEVIPFQYQIKGEVMSCLRLDGPSYLGEQEPLAVHKAGKAGAINLNNKVLVPFEYDFVLPILGNEREAIGYVLSKEGKCWVTDVNLKQTSDKTYTKFLGCFSQNINDVYYSNNVLVFDLNGKTLIYNSVTKDYSPNLQSFAYGSPMLITLNSEYKMGGLDPNGKVIFPYTYARVYGLDVMQNANNHFSFFAVDIDDKNSSIADKTGKLITTECFEPYSITETYIPGYLFARRAGKLLLLKVTADNKVQIIGRKEGYDLLYTNEELTGIEFKENGKRFKLGFDGKETPVK